MATDETGKTPEYGFMPAEDGAAAPSASTAEANKALVRRHIEQANNGGDVALVDTLVAPDYVWHGGGPANREELKRFLAWQRATSDWHIAIQEMVAEGRWWQCAR